jgi:DNA primase
VRIPQEKIEEIRNATDIVALIGGIVQLRKRGKNYTGLCPFHSEKTPSFTVSSDRQMYHCFGCGAGGNAITFVMEHEKVSFVDAVRSLAEKAGIPLPQATPDDEAQATEQERLYQVSRDAALFYVKSLTESPDGAIARDYFQKRGFSAQTLTTFGLGYSPNSWTGLVAYAEQAKLPLDLLSKAGLVRKRDDGTYFDYFHGRAMFPIVSHTGRVVGFGARKLREDDQMGKYVNSPETPIYSKSRILYGLYQAKEAIRQNDHVILVEGYADCISVFQAGFRNIVASSGTALTREQVELISRYTKNITIMYDGDEAGARASLRGLDVMLENDIDVRIAVLPSEHDPDSYVRAEGSDAFRKILDGAVSAVDFIAQSFEREGKLSTPEGQAQTVRAIVQTIGKMKDELKRSFYIKYVAEKYRLYESTLQRELEKILGKNVPARAPDGPPVSDQRQAGGDARVNPDSAPIPIAERDLVTAMIEGGRDVIEMVFREMDAGELEHPRTRALAEFLARKIETGTSFEPSLLVDEIQDPMERRLVAELVFSRYQLSKGWNERVIEFGKADPKLSASDAIIAIRCRRLEKRLEENKSTLTEVSRRGENVNQYLERNALLLDEIRELRKKIGKKEG